jgi:hypothetical protein
MKHITVRFIATLTELFPMNIKYDEYSFENERYEKAMNQVNNAPNPSLKRK